MNNSKFSFNLNTTGSATNTTTGGLFGSTSTTPNTATTTGSTIGGPQQTTLNLFGFGSKSATTTSNTTQQQPVGTGGLNTSSSFNTGFGQQQPKQTTLSFGNTSTIAAVQPFGTTNTMTPSNSSFSFNNTTNTQSQPTIGGFGSTQPQQQTSGGFGSGNLFNLNQQQQQQQQPQVQITPPTTLQEIDHLMNSLVNAQVFNDERDLILAKWNQLQAFYGIGKIFYQNMSIDVTKDNRLTRFKTIGYSCKPLYKNEDGLVCLIINQKDTQVRTNQKNVTDTLFKIFNSDQSLLIKVEAIKQIADDKTELAFYVEQRLSPVNESLKSRVPAMQVFQHLNKQEGVAASTTTSSFNLGGGLGTSNVANSLSTKQTIKQQLEQIGVTSFYPLMGLSDEQIKGYLDKPPAGFDHALWDQGKKKNPNPKKLLPVQIIGFQEINKRFKLQDQENHSQKISINLINDKIEAINSKNNIIRSKIEQFKARNEDLEQRILKVLINYELRRKSGVQLQENEKYLANILESFEIELSSPINKEIREQKFTKFNQVIRSIENASSNDLSKRQTTSLSSAATAASSLNDISNITDVQKSLREQHLAFKSLIEIINQDLKDLDTVKRGLLNEVK